MNISHSLCLLIRYCSKNVIVIVIRFYSPSCLGQEKAKGPFGFRVKLPLAHLSTTLDGGFTFPCNCWMSSREAAVNINFCSLWFYPTGNQTQECNFSSRRSSRLVKIQLSEQHFENDKRYLCYLSELGKWPINCL